MVRNGYPESLAVGWGKPHHECHVPTSEKAHCGTLSRSQFLRPSSLSGLPPIGDPVMFQKQDRITVSKARGYGVLDVESAKAIASRYLGRWALEIPVAFGLPEIDDRYHVWRVPLVVAEKEKVGEIVIDARTSLVQERRTSRREAVVDRSRLALGVSEPPKRHKRSKTAPISFPKLRNAIILGDVEESLAELPAESVGLAFTSPPYFNARPDYTEYVSYEEYLLKIRKVIQQVHRVLAEGRFFVMNTAPVLIRRASRSEASRRIAVPFDLHQIFVDEGFDFVDDIIWEKPEGAGWATGRGRRFAADRNPLQYKAVPVTEYILVYRKRTDRLIDWNIRNHPDQEAVERSRIGDGYERTNIWRISPTSSRDHPAVFPLEMAERVVRYYSFEGDVILDPFAGIGTTGEAAARLSRKFVLCEIDPEYVNVIRSRATNWPGIEAAEVMCVGCRPLVARPRLL